LRALLSAEPLPPLPLAVSTALTAPGLVPWLAQQPSLSAVLMPAQAVEVMALLAWVKGLYRLTADPR
jgi:hypothetical protein